MNAVDHAILEFYAKQAEGVVHSASIVWWNLCKDHRMFEKSRETIARRMRKIPEFGVLEKVDEVRACVRITEEGWDYPTSNLAAEDLVQDSE